MYVVFVYFCLSLRVSVCLSIVYVDLHVCLYASVCLLICMSVGLSMFVCLPIYADAYVRLYFCGYICLSVYLPETYQRIEPRCKRHTDKDGKYTRTDMQQNTTHMRTKIHIFRQMYCHANRREYPCLSIKTDRHNQNDRWIVWQKKDINVGRR